MAMTLDKLLLRAGIEVAKTETHPGRAVLLLRMAKQNFWNEVLREFLLASAKKPWTVDISKWFYIQDSDVRFLWRVVLSGDPRQGAEALGQAAMRAVQTSVEVVSQPLVGRRDYPFDPANGKMMGAHDARTAGAALATAIASKT